MEVSLIGDFYENWSDEASPFQLLLVKLIAGCGSMTGFLVSYSLILMIVRNRYQLWKITLQEYIEFELSVWISGDYTTDYLVDLFQEEIDKDRRAKEIILQVIFSTSKLFREDGQSPLREILERLHLHSYCYKQLNSRRWHRQAFAAQVIGQLHLTDALPLLKKKLTTQHPGLRLELITAVIALCDQECLQNLEKINIHLSDWEQILLLERFRRVDTSEMLLLDTWLTSASADWALFGVRLCRYYNRFDKIAEMGALLNHADQRVQFAVLDAFAYLGSPESTPLLVDYVQQASGPCLASAIQALGKQGDPDLVEFIVPYFRYPDATVQFSALNALKEMGLSKEELEEKAEHSQFIEQLFDPKLA